LESGNEKIPYCSQEEAGLEMLFIEGQYVSNILSDCLKLIYNGSVYIKHRLEIAE